MANPNKQGLSRTLSDMKFMKRRSTDKADLSTSDGVFVDKWLVPNVPEPLQRAKWPEVHDSYVDFEELNRLGRFSYNKYNKETERLMEAYRVKLGEEELSEGEIEFDEDEDTVKIAEVVKRYKDLGMREEQIIGKRKRH